MTHTTAVLAVETTTNMAPCSTSPDEPPAPPSTLPAAGLYPHPVPTAPPDREERALAVREVWQKNCDGLTPSEQGLLWQLLLEFKNCFSLSEDYVGRTDLIQHNIETGDAQPIRMRPRRLPLARQVAADKALREMQQAGLTKPSTSSCASLIVMVPKNVTKKDPYRLPCIDEATLAGSSWFSSLDLCSGYWHVPLAPEARPKTAFITSGGLWQFKFLPFGLCNAPAMFERLMDKVLAVIPRQECVMYLDDILVHD